MKYIKKVIFLICIMAIFILEACASKGMDDAYSIREQYDGGGKTKVNIEENISSKESTSSKENMPAVPKRSSFKVNLNGAKMIEPTDTMKYGTISLQVLDFERGDSIYDVTKVLDEEQSSEFIQYIFNKGKSIQENGRFNSMDSADQCKLYFLKVRITNQSDNEAVLHIKSIFYGITQDKAVRKMSSSVYDFYGEHYRKNNFANGDEYIQFMPKESKETVLLVGMNDVEKYDSYYNANADSYTTLYLSSTSLDGYVDSGGFDLPAGSTLMKLMEDGKVLLHE